MKKFLQISILSLLIANSSIAQQLPMYSQYYINPFLYNPSMAGASEGIKANLLHKSQWRDIPGAPETSVLTFDGPVTSKNAGLGATIINDVSGLLQRQGAYGAYSYRIRLNDEHTVLAGLSVGVLNNRIDFRNALVKDVNDPFLMQGAATRATVDANIGATYLWKELEFGLAAPHAIGQKFRFMSNESSSSMQEARHFLISAKYSFMVNEIKGITAYPLILARITNGTPVQYDVDAVVNWQNIGWGAISYKSNYAVGMNIGIMLSESFKAGYAYDYPIGNLGGYTGGASEIMLGYIFNRRSTSQEEVAEFQPDTQYDLMVDSMLYVLRKSDEEQKSEIKRLEDEINKLKENKVAENPVVQPVIKENPEVAAVKEEVLADEDVRIAKTDDFDDEEGTKMEKGIYVIIGAFQKKENALKALKTAQDLGYTDSHAMYNHNKQLHYVYISKTVGTEGATETLKKIRAHIPDSWVFILE